MSDTAFLIAGMVIGLLLFSGLYLVISSGTTSDGAVGWEQHDYEWHDYQETGEINNE